MKNRKRSFFFWFSLFFFFSFFWLFSDSYKNKKFDRQFSEILESIESGEVRSIIINGQKFSGEYKNGLKFNSYGFLSDTIIDKLFFSKKNYGTDYEIKEKETDNFFSFIQWIPLVLMLFLFFFFFKQIQAGSGKAMSFGKSKAKFLEKDNKKTTFKDVAGIDECIEDLQEIVLFLKSPERFTNLGGRMPKGVLLIGAPGTGKTLLARAIAGEAEVPFLSIAGSDFVEVFVGIGASRVRDLFETAKKNSPCIIFIDEIDSVGRQRGTGMGGGHDEREQTLNQLLVEMDGFEANKGIIIIAATNRPDVLDPAILRSGRFDKKISVPMPDIVGRKKILNLCLLKIKASKSLDLNYLSKITIGMTGADIDSLINESSIIAAKKNKKEVEFCDIEEAREKLIMGSPRKHFFLNKIDLKKIAYHEAGHALMSVFFYPISDSVHKVTIIPRGNALGVTVSMPKDDRFLYEKKFMECQISILMSGRIAEELIFNEITSGAKNDFEKATEIAHSMVCELGMSKKMGPISYNKKNNELFLGRDFGKMSNFSEQTAFYIDFEIKKIISFQYKKASFLLKNNIKILHKLAFILVKKETVSGDELLRIVNFFNIKK